MRRRMPSALGRWALRWTRIERNGPVSSATLSNLIKERYTSWSLPERREGLLSLSKDLFSKLDDEAKAKETLRFASIESRPLVETVERLRSAWSFPGERALEEISISLEKSPEFLVKLREDLLSFNEAERKAGRVHRELDTMDVYLRRLLATLFTGGLLTLERISLASSGYVLDQIVQHEAVHKIKSLEELGRRLSSGKRVFGFFHPSLGNTPLAFVHCALMAEPPRVLQQVNTAKKVDTPLVACFYTISATQPGLAGIEIGSLLIKRVVVALKKEFPSLESFITLSPVPRFAPWLASKKSPIAENVVREMKKFAASDDESRSVDPVILEQGRRLVAEYLTTEKQKNNKARASCTVANFHVRNGAELWRVNALGDLTPEGMAKSFGFMVNYRYNLNNIDYNAAAYEQEGKIALGDEVKELLMSSNISNASTKSHKL